MLDSLRLEQSQRLSAVIVGAGLGFFCILLAIYPSPGHYSLLGGITVHDRGEFSILGMVVTAGLGFTVYVLLTVSRLQEWGRSLRRPVQFLLGGLIGATVGAVAELVDVTVISTKSMLVGLGVSALLLTFTRVMLSKYAGIISLIETR